MVPLDKIPSRLLKRIHYHVNQNEYGEGSHFNLLIQTTFVVQIIKAVFSILSLIGGLSEIDIVQK